MNFKMNFYLGVNLNIFIYIFRTRLFCCQLGFHKAVGEHNISLSKRILSASFNIEEENNRNA
jgi:hypothetical protein